jgi:hypothetical protein|tara:strand:+ start:13528 stop:14778 length:1251 start_codon:yes stop_codon:yes gene_type:complete
LKEPYYTSSTCRLCQSEKLERAVSLGLSPVSEKYVNRDELGEPGVMVPLDLYFCSNCSHVQLVDVVEPEYLWSDYTFRTGDNPALIEHFSDYASRVHTFANLNETDLIIDVGSNDGTLLKSWQRKGFRNVLGVDPAIDIGAEANAAGVETLIGFLNQAIAEKILEQHGRAKLITANNVYAHCDDLIGMTQAIRSVLDPDGLFTFEASYLLDIVEKDLIGTIFHEHLSYHSVISLQSFFLRQDMELVHVERGPEQGGSIVGYVQHRHGPWRETGAVQGLVDLERSRKLDQLKPLNAMEERLNDSKEKLQQIIRTVKKKGGKIAGFGAARAGTTLLSFFQIGSDLEFLMDDNTNKHHKYSPGDRLEVLPTTSIYDRSPECVVILAWIHAENIISKHQQYLKRGGAFVRIFPRVEIVRG